jgi:NAD(P)H-quinone oxidoreductase subunit 5
MFLPWNGLLGATIIIIGPLLLAALILAPRTWVNKRVELVTRLAQIGTLAILAVALVGPVLLLDKGYVQHNFLNWRGLQFGVFYDALSAVVFLLVSFLGVVITRYACTYLQGEADRGHFLKWLCVTLGSVLMLLVSGNMVQFTVTWIATSVSLHQLLLFNSHRPSAVIAARKKFVISRLGDLCLIASVILIYRVFGTGDFRSLFVAAEAFGTSGRIPPLVTPICLLLTGAAIMKSAQFPFHSWLPDTMETPTPVSALMHAGIVNSGGFLIVRLSPVVSLCPTALDTLAVVGAFTAVFASVVMLTQASIKRMLAFSTVAQMGFMLLECGLGAYTVAVLHIIAHSLYKAHAFLTSGNAGVSGSKSSYAAGDPAAAHPGRFAMSFVSAMLVTFAAARLPGISRIGGPAELVLTATLGMSVTYLLWRLWSTSVTPVAIATGLLLAGVVCTFYYGLHYACHVLLGYTLNEQTFFSTINRDALNVVLVLLFGALLLFQSQLPQWSSRSWCRTLYVHARNGFYFNTLFNRAIKSLWPVQ